MPNLYQKYGRKRVIIVIYLVGVALIALTMQLLSGFKLYHSSLVYVLVPYLISVAITVFRSWERPKNPKQKYFSHIATATTLLFSFSLLIGEGFICILFFAPIYLLVVTVAFIARKLSDGDKKYAMVIPAVIVVLSMEGISPGLSLSRHSSVQVVRTTQLSAQQVVDNISRPFTLSTSRHWLLSIFPMPYRIDTNSLETGAIHTVYTRYHRWFFTNTHEGKAEFLIENISDKQIKTTVLSDTTYFSTYLSGTGTQVDLTPTADGGTQIKLTLNYRRNLDPAWYFHPLQKYGVSKMGELIITEMMIRDSGSGYGR